MIPWMRVATLTLIGAVTAAPMFSQTIVATRPIKSKAVITANDVGVIATSQPGAAERLEQVIGQETRVTVYPGRPILLGDIGAPAVVVRNQIVTMIYDIGGLRITAEGRALDRAGFGEAVRIMNIDSRATVVGKVRSDGAVEVGYK